MKKKNEQGLTLVEVLVALAVFVVVSLIAASVFQESLKMNTRISQDSEYREEVGLFIGYFKGRLLAQTKPIKAFVGAPSTPALGRVLLPLADTCVDLQRNCKDDVALLWAQITPGKKSALSICALDDKNFIFDLTLTSESTLKTFKKGDIIAIDRLTASILFTVEAEMVTYSPGLQADGFYKDKLFNENPDCIDNVRSATKLRKIVLKPVLLPRTGTRAPSLLTVQRALAEGPYSVAPAQIFISGTNRAAKPKTLSHTECRFVSSQWACKNAFLKLENINSFSLQNIYEYPYVGHQKIYSTAFVDKHCQSDVCRLIPSPATFKGALAGESLGALKAQEFTVVKQEFVQMFTFFTEALEKAGEGTSAVRLQVHHVNNF